MNAIVIDMQELAAARERLLRSAIGVREAIDEECDETGVISSLDPEYERKSARFDLLLREEAVAWAVLKRVRGGGGR